MDQLVDLQGLADRLEASGDYKVLRRLQHRAPGPASPVNGARLAVVLDVETTGIDPRGDEIIELAMVRFWYCPAGEVLGVDDTFQAFHQPTKPITAEITAITGIDDAMVDGHSLDLEAVGAFVAPAQIVLAHNAQFDRVFTERLHPYFSTKAWACTMSEPPWREEGCEGLKLAYLAAHFGFFYDKHRAVNDCMATLELLASPLPRCGQTVLAALLAKARRPTWRVWAQQAPYDQKTALKQRGYRWSDGEDGRPRAWWTDVTEQALEAELAYLKSEIYQCEADVLTRRLTAFDRYSDRA
ncbi:MAG: 3'-5' exonuclease [Caulobacteraceae bacterium]